jgi:hypothetical protein
MRVVTLDCTRCSRRAARVTPPSSGDGLEDGEIGEVHRSDHGERKHRY